jgi:hypothetical protein
MASPDPSQGSRRHIQVVAKAVMQHDPRHHPALRNGRSDTPVVLQSNANVVSKMWHLFYSLHEGYRPSKRPQPVNFVFP